MSRIKYEKHTNNKTCDEWCQKRGGPAKIWIDTVRKIFERRHGWTNDIWT